MKYMRIVFVVILAALLAACGGGAGSGGGGAQSTGANPADVARSALEIMISGEGDLAPLICSAAADQVDGMRASFAGLSQSGAEVDISGLTFTTQNESGDTAEVVVAGTIKVTVAGTETENPFPEMTIPMKNENGWKVCS